MPDSADICPLDAKYELKDPKGNRPLPSWELMMAKVVNLVPARDFARLDLGPFLSAEDR